jgi:hypothetical protein
MFPSSCSYPRRSRCISPARGHPFPLAYQRPPDLVKVLHHHPPPCLEDPPWPASICTTPSWQAKVDRAPTLATSKGGWGPHARDKQGWMGPAHSTNDGAALVVTEPACLRHGEKEGAYCEIWGGGGNDVEGRVDEKREIKWLTISWGSNRTWLNLSLLSTSQLITGPNPSK